MRKINRIFNKKRRIYIYQAGGKGVSNVDNAQFMDWYVGFAEKRDLDPNPESKEHLYDYRGYWEDNKKELYSNDEIEKHLPDTWKLPGHPTFSVQSKYSTTEKPGGTWDGENFIHSKFTEEYWAATSDYLWKETEGKSGSFFSDGTEIVLDKNGKWPVNRLYPGVNQNKFNEYVDKVRGSRKGSRDNNDGTHSSVIMQDGSFTDDDGNNVGVAFPSLYQEKDGSWYTPDDPVKESKDKKEGYIFDSPGKANWFARGAWKKRYYDRDKGKFTKEQLDKGPETKPLKQAVKEMEKKQSGGVLYQKFQSGGHYTEPDWRGNKYTPGINDIHQGYEHTLARDYGEGFDMDKLYRYFGAVGSHEGSGNMVSAQRLGGPGRGVFQIEDNENGNHYRDQYEKFMRIKRLKMPEWFTEWKGTNASNLGKSEQLELLMAYNYFGDNKDTMFKFMSGEISPGELAAVNHKRTFTAKGKPGAVGYKTKAEMRVDYVKSINDLYKTQDDSTVNKVLFDNKYKTDFPNVPDNTTTLTRAEDFGYRCGDDKCALNDETRGPITIEEASKRAGVAKKKEVLKNNDTYSIMTEGEGIRSRDSYRRGGILTRRFYQGGGIDKPKYDSAGRWKGRKGDVTVSEALEGGSKNGIIPTMLNNVTVTEDIGDKRKWMLNRGTALGWDQKGNRTYDSRTTPERKVDELSAAGGLWAAPLTGYLDMVNKGSKIITGGGTGPLPSDGADPANSNRKNAGTSLALDAVLMAATGGLGGGLQAGLKNKATALVGKHMGKTLDGVKNGVLHGLEGVLEKNTNKLLKSKVSGKIGDYVYDTAEKLRNSSFRGRGNNVFTATNNVNGSNVSNIGNSLTSNIAATYVDDNLKSVINSLLTI